MKDYKLEYSHDEEHNLKWPLSWTDHETHVLCHPENMKTAELRLLLKQKQLDINDLDLMDVSQLIELYNKILLPFPQRSYNQTCKWFERRKGANKRRVEEYDGHIKRFKTCQDVTNHEIKY